MRSFATSLILASTLSVSPLAGAVEAPMGYPRVNPVAIEHESDWEVDLHDGDRNGWKIEKIIEREYDLDELGERRQFRAILQNLLVRNQSRDFLPGDAVRALEDSIALVDYIDRPGIQPRERYEAYSHLRETIDAFNHVFEFPVPKKIWMGSVPIRILQELAGHRIMFKRSRVATNLNPYSLERDKSKVDPYPSSFWQPRPIETIDLYGGYGRAKPTDLSNTVCLYKKPKKSYGTHGGFEADCGGQRLKFKFGNESYTEPFNARLLWALGYNVPHVDHVVNARVAYDRRVLTEYNLRKDMTIRIRSFVGFTYFKYNVQLKYDPFIDAVAGAVTKDGRTISAEELRRGLVPRKNVDWKALKDTDFDSAFEATIAQLWLRPASVETAVEHRELGSWDYNELDHIHRREVRAFGIVAAYLNMFDVRTDNNSLEVVPDESGKPSLKHFFSDVGSGFGSATRVLKFSNFDLNKFPWDLVEAREDSRETGYDDADTDIRWVFSKYGTIEENDAFERIQLDDAKWMTRMLCRVTDAQLNAALIAAGFSAAELKLAFAKLKSRRAQLVRAFGLDAESPSYAAIARARVDRDFSYDPRKEVAPSTLTSSGETKSAWVGFNRVVNGILVRF